MTGQHDARQVVEAGRTRLAPVTLSTGLRVVAPVPGDRGTIASGAARTLRPAMLAHKREALGVVHQPGKVDQVGCRHDDAGSSREPVGCSRSCHHTRYPPAAPLTSTTPEPDKSHDRYRPDGGFDDGPSAADGMPHASRNHRAPTAGDTPAHTAASSLDWPVAIAAQNRRRSSRRATPGRPGDPNLPRRTRSERRRPAIAPPSIPVLRQPLESAHPSRRSITQHRRATCRCPPGPAARQQGTERAAATRSSPPGSWDSPLD